MLRNLFKIKISNKQKYKHKNKKTCLYNYDNITSHTFNKFCDFPFKL